MKSRVYLSEDEKNRAAHLVVAGKKTRAQVAREFKISPSAIYHYIKNGYGTKQVETAPPDRSLEDLMWFVVIKAQEKGFITVGEARRLLELVK